MSLRVSVEDPLFHPVKMGESGDGAVDLASTSAVASDGVGLMDTTRSSTSSSADIAKKLEGLALREKTDFLRGKLASGSRAGSGENGKMSTPLSALSKIADAYSRVSPMSTKDGSEVRSLSWPSAHDRGGDEGKKIHHDDDNHDGDRGVKDNRRSSLDGAGVAKPLSWPCSPLVKPGAALFNKDTTFKEGLGVPINYAEGRNSLTHVLENIQLCYNPASKQLHRLPLEEEGPSTRLVE